LEILMAASDQFVRLLPVFLSLLLGLGCAFLLWQSSLAPLQVTPFSESSLGVVGSLANAVYFAVLAGVGATVLYFLLRRRKRRLITAITGFALTVAAFMLSLIYLSAGLSGLLIPYVGLIVVVASVLLTVGADYAIFGARRFSAVAVLGIGAGLGTFLGFSLSTPSTILVLSALAVYDVYAVYRGSVGKMARDGIDELRGLSFSFRDVQMGLGDLTFYCMLSGHMFLYFGFAACLASMLGILIGCLVSFFMLERREMFPGLPFPIFVGLAAGFIVLLL
jgi:presenilin-like A22 family membrane protease